MKTRIRGRRTWILGALAAAFVPVAPAPAQTTLQWNGRSSMPAASAPATSVPAIRSPASAVPTMPLPSTFDAREFEAMAQTLVAGQRVPGLALALVQNGRVLSARGYGITDTAGAEPVDAHTVFRLASLSKGFAGTVTGLMVSEGKLRWDSPVTEYVPGFHLRDPYASRQLTVADVLSHRVGISHNAFDRALERYEDYSVLRGRLASLPLKCQPGDCYAYQNIAFSLVGDVLGAATGINYSDAVEQRLFNPLGMKDASLGLDGIYASQRWAKPHVRGRGGWVSVSPKPTYYQVAPAAGVNASASDMAQWLIAQTGHRQDVLPEPLLATLHAPVIATPGEARGSRWRRERLNSASYALGWRVYDYAGHSLVFHGGAVQGYRAAIAMLPDRDFGVAILWNSESSLPSGLLPTIIDRALGLTPQSWMNDEVLEDARYAYEVMLDPDRRFETTDRSTTTGVQATTSNAAPQ
jgi:beta-lactamase class C